MPNYCDIRSPHLTTKTLFDVSKYEILKKQLEEAFGIELKKSFRVCASYFHEFDVDSS